LHTLEFKKNPIKNESKVDLVKRGQFYQWHWCSNQL